MPWQSFARHSPGRVTCGRVAVNLGKNCRGEGARRLNDQQKLRLCSRYALAILVAAGALLLRLALAPILGVNAPYITAFPAIVISALYGGLGPALISTLFSAFATLYFVIPPRSSFGRHDVDYALGTLVFLFVGTSVSWLSESSLRARQRAETAELKERRERQLFQQTLSAIGDAVISTDAEGRVEFMNLVAEHLTGWKSEEIIHTSVTAILQMENEDTRAPVRNPVERALAEGLIVELEDRTVLIAKDGARRPIEDSAAPIRDEGGRIIGGVLVFRDVSERRQAEAHLHQQWQTFDTALSHTPDLTYTCNLEGRFTYANRALLALLQRSLEEVQGKDFVDLEYPPELAQRLHRRIQQVIDTKQSLRDESPFTGPTGESRQYEYIFVPVFAANGGVDAVAVSTRDVTERKRAEDLAQEDRRRWRELLFHTPAAVAVIRGAEHRYEWVNAEYIRLVGRTAEALVGKTVLEAVPELEGQSYVTLLNRVYQTGEPFIGHESLARLNHGEGILRDVYLNFIYLAIRNVAGQIDGIFCHATDVTDMVVTRKRIEESERQFRTLAECIPHLAWMADETGHIFWYNRRWYDYTGTTFEEMEGWGWKKVHDPKVLPTVLTQWEGAISSGAPFEMVFPLKGAGGAFRSFLTRVEPVKDNHGNVVRWFGTNTDITDQRRTEEELRRMNRELEEFAYVASHDLQEPLRMVNIYTHLILKTLGGSDVRLNQYAGIVQDGVNRMEALIRDLLTFSRAVHAGELPFTTVDLSASLSEALSVLKTRIEESGAIITAQRLPTVRGDTGQMPHVFQNLLSNALKYCKKDVRPEIYITVKPDGNQWIVSVRDNGIGFEPQYAERIFGLFKRLHKHEYPGTGLGLAICQRIVERCGGRMWAEGRPTEGATFHFSLPRIDVA